MNRFIGVWLGLVYQNQRHYIRNEETAHESTFRKKAENHWSLTSKKQCTTIEYYRLTILNKLRYNPHIKGISVDKV